MYTNGLLGGGMIPEQLPTISEELELSKPMQERLIASLETEMWPSEDDCKQVLGKAHLGIIPLPRTGDSFEQP